MRVVVFLGAMLSLGGCDIATDLFETPAAVEADFEAQHGLTVSTGFNSRNGRLETVTLQFVAEEVEELSLADLQTVSEPIVLRHFERAPRHLILAVAVDGRTMRDRIRE